MRTATAVALGLTVGPAFAGESVMWGEERPNGATRFVLDLPDREPLLVHRIAPPTARDTERGFRSTPGSFAASADRFAAVVVTSTWFQEDFDSASVAVTSAAVSGRFTAPVEVVSGAVPARGDESCAGGRPAYQYVDAVALDGERLAVGQFEDECTEDNGPWTDTVKVYDGGAVTTVHSGEQGMIRDVALAGRFVAWVRDAEEDELVVHDVEAGAAVLRLTQDDLAARGLDELALQDDGTVAFLFSNRNFQRLAWAAPGTPGARTLARGEFRGLALDGGRVLYERVRRFTGELLLRSLGGGPPRRLASFSQRRRRVGDLDLAGTRAAWATHPTKRGYDPPATGPARVVVRDL